MISPTHTQRPRSLRVASHSQDASANLMSSSDDVEEDECCQTCGRDDDDENMVLCDDCNSGVHYFCCGLRRLPGEKDSFICPRCKDVKRNDRHVQSCARVSVYWKAPYNSRFEGEVQQVRVRPNGGREYLVWYSADDEQWQKAKELGLLDGSVASNNSGASLTTHRFDAKRVHGSWLIEPDEPATSKLRAEDPLVTAQVRVSLFHEGSKRVRRGRYHGRVLDVRREKTIEQQGGSYHGQILHLVEYDAGDRHWHVLNDPRWEFRREDAKAQAARLLAPPGKVAPVGEVKHADKGKLVAIDVDPVDDHEGERRQRSRDVIERALERDADVGIGGRGSSSGEGTLVSLLSMVEAIEAAAYATFDSADYAKCIRRLGANLKSNRALYVPRNASDRARASCVATLCSLLPCLPACGCCPLLLYRPHAPRMALALLASCRLCPLAPAVCVAGEDKCSCVRSVWRSCCRRM